MKKADVLNLTGATSTDILAKIDDGLDRKIESIMIQFGTNDLTNDVKLLSNAKKIVSKTNRTSSNTSACQTLFFEKIREI